MLAKVFVRSSTEATARTFKVGLVHRPFAHTGGFLKPIQQRINAANKLLQDLVTLFGHLNLRH
jgi:hypothetical protein